MDSAAVRSYFDYGPAQTESRLAVIRTAVTIVLLGSGVVAALAAVAGVVLSQSVDTRVSAVAVGVALGVMPLTNGQLIARVAFLLPRRRTAYLTASLLNAILGTAAAVVLVRLGLGPTGYFIGLGVGAAVALAFCVSAGGIARRDRWLDRREAGVMLRYGLPLVPAALATWAIFAIDRALIASLKGLGEAGLYALASKVTAPLLLLATAFATAWGPFIMREGPRRRLELRARALPAVAGAAGIAFVWLVLFAEPLVDALGGSDFDAADRAVPGIALGWFGWMLAIVLQTELAVTRRTTLIALVTGIGAAANIVANLAFIPRWGFVGAAWATAGSFGLVAAIYAGIEARTTRPPYDLRRLALVAVAVGAASAALLLDATVLRAVVAAAATIVIAAVVARERPTL
jgi:O-antigen/teichoic acid export membrane protein